METIFDKNTRDELINRVRSLDRNSQAQWGKMSVGQMVKHCTKWDEMAFGEKKYKQSFLGKLVGKFALKDMMKDQPIKKNLPTVPSFKTTENIEIEVEKSKWISLLEGYEHFSNEQFIHPFFGKMTQEEIGIMAYKHIDHHLRQFNS